MKKEITVTAKTVDEAVAKAVAELGAPSADSITYEVVEAPKKGLFGIGAGVFTGCLAAALAEVVNMMPVLSERVSLKKGMVGIMLLFALGKLAGSLFGLLA